MRPELRNASVTACQWIFFCRFVGGMSHLNLWSGVPKVLRKATHTYAELTSNGRLQAAMHELQALGRVPVTLFMFNDASTHLAGTWHPANRDTNLEKRGRRVHA